MKNLKLPLLAIVAILALTLAACEDYPEGHESYLQCLGCHADGAGDAPRVPTTPDHATLADDRTVCLACHFGD